MQKVAVQYASKTDTRWIQHTAKANPLGPRSLRALVWVDRKGRLALIYTKLLDGEFAKASIQLVAGDEALFTHAAFSPTNDGRLLIALHAYNGKLSTYFVRIENLDGKQGPGAGVNLAVELAATSLPSTSSNSVMSGQVYGPEFYALTHLGIVPTPEVEKPENAPPTVYGVYSSMNKNVTATDPGFLMAGVIRKWNISSIEQQLHPRFNELLTKSINETPIPITSVQRLPDKDEQVITAASLIDNGQTLTITTQDGRTDFLSTEDLSPLSYQASSTEAYSLSQCGFSFPIVSAPSCIALSPSACVKAFVTSSNRLELATMDFPSSLDDPTSPAVEAAIAAVVVSLSRAIWASANIDDILAVVLHSVPPSLAVPLITTTYRTLLKDAEFINDRIQGSLLDQVVQKPVLLKVISFHYMVSHLTLKHEPRPTQSATTRKLSLSTQWAYLATNLRFTAFLLMIVAGDYKTPPPPTNREPLTPDFTDIVCANIKWVLDLLRYTVAKILEVEDRETNPDFFPPMQRGEEGLADGSQGLVALLLNCHWSRRLLVTVVNAMKVLLRPPEPRTRQHVQILRAIAEGSHLKGVGLPAVDQILNGGWSEPGDVGTFQEMAARQVEMMATGIVTGGYRGTVKRLLARALGVEGQLRKPGLREKGGVDRLKVWGDDVDERWLMLDSSIEKGGKRYDVHRKKVIERGMREAEAGPLMIKRCVRCGRYSEDVNGALGKIVWKYVGPMVVRCVCDGNWVIEPWEG